MSKKDLHDKNLIVGRIYQEMRKSLMVSVKIDHEQVLELIVKDLISKRNCPTNEIKESFDAVLKYYLGREDFQKYVIKGEEI